MNKFSMQRLGIIVLLLLAVVSAWAAPDNNYHDNNDNAYNGNPHGTLPGNLPEQAYVIELKNISPDLAVTILQSEQFKQFLPPDVTALISIPRTQKLLIQTQNPASAIRMTQLVSLIDKPDRLALQVMLIIMPSRPPEGGQRQPMPVADGTTPLVPTAVQTWVQSLIDTYRGSVVLFPDQPVMLVTPPDQLLNILTMPSFVTDIGSIMISNLAYDQANAVAGERRFTAEVRVSWRPGGQEVTTTVPPATRAISLVMGMTTLVPLHELGPVLTNVAPPPDVNGKRFYLALTPKVIQSPIPELAPTIYGGLVFRGNGGGTSKSLDDMLMLGN
ncbi:MAG: hypothetical protein ACYDCO_03880 [Armatimonadota bacterium]